MSASVILIRDPSLLLMIKEKQSEELAFKYGLVNDVSDVMMRDSIQSGVQYLMSIQTIKGWEKHPGITALCLRAVAGLVPEKDIALAVGFLLSCQEDDGAFYISYSVGSALKNYTTAVSILALTELNKLKYKVQIEKAANFLKQAQIDESEGVSPDDPNYGGLGYSGSKKADLGNLHQALEALSAAGVSEKDKVFQRAQVFLKRVQGSEGEGEVEDIGGFVYKPKVDDDTRASKPYGVMSFAGLKSLLLSGVDKNDQRVQQALGWIERNYSSDQHPGKGEVSFFYYHVTLAKAMNLVGSDKIAKEGKSVNWKRETVLQLIKRQRKDGSWHNPTRKYMEGLSSLATAYALLALKEAEK